MSTPVVEPALLRNSEGRFVTAAQITAELDLVLASSYFRNSKRHQRFLHFLIERYLAGASQEIKERTIGVEVFDRAPAYDVTSDPIVRGAAADLRKRLALYYAEAAHSAELRIEIPLGSYIPQFQWPSVEGDATKAEIPRRAGITETDFAAPGTSYISSEVEPALQVAISKSTLRRVLLGICVAAALIAVSFTVFYTSTAQRQLRDLNVFWRPLLSSGDNVLICAGSLNGIMNLPQVENDTWDHVTKTRNHLDPNIGVALVSISEFLGARGKHPALRISDLTSLPDLRNQPVVFIGGFNNQWTERLLSNMRYRLQHENGQLGEVIDTKSGNHVIGTFDFSAPVNSISRSYAIVTRTNDPLTGQNVISLSGLGSYGNSSASEFVVSPTYFAQFVQRAPKDWRTHDVQIVLETSVVDGKSSPPRVVALDIGH